MSERDRPAAVASWRDASDAEVVALCDAERSRWLAGLGWDPSAALATARAARARGIDSGLIARGADGAVRGWARFAAGRGDLRIGTLAGDDRGTVEALLDALSDRAARAGCRWLSCFLYPDSDTVAAALDRRGFALCRHPYLSKDLASAAAVPAGTWPPPGLAVVTAAAGATERLARLLARAYAGTPMAARFAPHASIEEWCEWVGQVFNGLACGEALPAASLAVQDDRGRMTAAVLTTQVGPGVAHVAQVVVDPAARRQGIARGLLSSAFAAAARGGCSAITLMVAEDNSHALELYRALGFEPSANLLWGRKVTRAG